MFHFRNLSLILFSSLLLSVFACEDEEVVEEIEAPVSIEAVEEVDVNDIANSESAADIEVWFRAPLDQSNIEEYRIFVVPINNEFNVELALEVSEGSYESVTATALRNKLVVLSNDLLDTDGEEIVNNVFYHLYILSVGKESISSALSEGESFQITNRSLISGTWTGTGTSSLFPAAYSVTFALTENDGILSGIFYLNSTTQAGWGGSNDGTFYAELDGSTLTNVEVVQDLDDIDCPGVFSGTGSINISVGGMSINWTGTDCSGFHDNGVFTLTKL
ncbi:MAG: hypothetical protein NXI20_08475 [bacterium]|nr:hypothetical protein [bacterium]